MRSVAFAVLALCGMLIQMAYPDSHYELLRSADWFVTLCLLAMLLFIVIEAILFMRVPKDKIESRLW